MSIESAKAFFERVTVDEAFRTQVESYPIDERANFLGIAGYDFTPEEWETATGDFFQKISTNEEINELELEAISGGVIYPDDIFPIPGPFPCPFPFPFPFPIPGPTPQPFPFPLDILQ